MERATSRQLDEVNKKFMQFYSQIIPLIDGLELDCNTGEIIIPDYIISEMEFVNKGWNYHAMLFNKKLKRASANYAAVKTRFYKDVEVKESKMFTDAVVRILKEKYNLTNNKIGEFVARYKADGISPEQVCDKIALETEPDKIHWYKHRHSWTVIQGENSEFIIICKSCGKQYCKKYISLLQAQKVAIMLPKTNLGSLINHFKNYN